MSKKSEAGPSAYNLPPTGSAEKIKIVNIPRPADFETPPPKGEKQEEENRLAKRVLQKTNQTLQEYQELRARYELMLSPGTSTPEPQEGQHEIKERLTQLKEELNDSEALLTEHAERCDDERIQSNIDRTLEMVRDLESFTGAEKTPTAQKKTRKSIESSVNEHRSELKKIEKDIRSRPEFKKARVALAASKRDFCRKTGIPYREVPVLQGLPTSAIMRFIDKLAGNRIPDKESLAKAKKLKDATVQNLLQAVVQKEQALESQWKQALEEEASFKGDRSESIKEIPPSTVVSPDTIRAVLAEQAEKDPKIAQKQAQDLLGVLREYFPEEEDKPEVVHGVFDVPQRKKSATGSASPELIDRVFGVHKKKEEPTPVQETKSKEGVDSSRIEETIVFFGGGEEGREKAMRMWDAIQQQMSLMEKESGPFSFSALEYVHTAAERDKSYREDEEMMGELFQKEIDQMNRELGYPEGMDPSTGSGMGASRLQEARALGGRKKTRAEQEREQVAGIGLSGTPGKTRSAESPALGHKETKDVDQRILFCSEAFGGGEEGRANAARLWEEIHKKAEEKNMDPMDYVYTAAQWKSASRDGDADEALRLRATLNDLNQKLGFSGDPVSRILKIPSKESVPPSKESEDIQIESRESTLNEIAEVKEALIPEADLDKGTLDKIQAFGDSLIKDTNTRTQFKQKLISFFQTMDNGKLLDAKMKLGKLNRTYRRWSKFDEVLDWLETEMRSAEKLSQSANKRKVELPPTLPQVSTEFSRTSKNLPRTLRQVSK